jgi:hypothetical protein
MVGKSSDKPAKKAKHIYVKEEDVVILAPNLF